MIAIELEFYILASLSAILFSFLGIHKNSIFLCSLNSVFAFSIDDELSL